MATDRLSCKIFLLVSNSQLGLDHKYLSDIFVKLSLQHLPPPCAQYNRLRLQVGLHMLVPRARTALLQRRALAVNGPSNWNCLHTLLRAKLVSGIFLTSSSSFKAFLYPRGSRADMKREHFHNCAKATQFLHPGNQGRRYFVDPDSL